jgi:hypothetical protein
MILDLPPKAGKRLSAFSYEDVRIEISDNLHKIPHYSLLAKEREGAWQWHRKENLNFILKIAVYLSLCLHEGRLSFFVGQFCPPGSRSTTLTETLEQSTYVTFTI